MSSLPKHYLVNSPMHFSHHLAYCFLKIESDWTPNETHQLVFKVVCVLFNTKCMLLTTAVFAYFLSCAFSHFVWVYMWTQCTSVGRSHGKHPHIQTNSVTDGRRETAAVFILPRVQRKVCLSSFQFVKSIFFLVKSVFNIFHACGHTECSFHRKTLLIYRTLNAVIQITYLFTCACILNIRTGERPELKKKADMSEEHF